MLNSRFQIWINNRKAAPILNLNIKRKNFNSNNLLGGLGKTSLKIVWAT
jgi:hypothetical protein